MADPISELWVCDCFLQRGDDRAAAVAAGEALAPFLRGPAPDRRGDRLRGRRGIAGIIAERGIEPDDFAELVPELLLQGCGGDDLSVRGRVEPVARRSAGDAI